jgi:hypothetical protein
LATFDMKEYARRGAEARLKELSEEIDAIHRAFPDLRDSRRRGRRPGASGSGNVVAEQSFGRGGARKRRKMTAAERKAVGERMRKYWAARRSETASKKR